MCHHLRWGIISLVVIPLFLVATPAFPQTNAALSTQERAFLDDLEHRAFLFFWEQADPHTGLVRDRSGADGASKGVASIAATGFGLTALCIAADRHWISPEEARDRARITLRFFNQRAYQQHGWFYHWMNPATGAREWNSEVSSIDTALLLAGVLTVRQCFASDKEIEGLATDINHRVDFQWMLNGDRHLLAMGWFPDKGFIAARWDHYCELMILYLLAIGSPTHSIPAESWYAWSRPPIDYGPYHFIYGDRPLFVHQYAHAWIDFRNRKESRPPFINWFKNSVVATRANREFCIRLHSKFSGYLQNIWGITASDSAKGYIAWGGPPDDPRIDGTVVPCAPGGSLMFTPDISLPALWAMRDKFGDRVYRRYGFVDAFNPTTGWTDTDVIGIDQGITLLSAENLRSGNVWRWFMENPEAQRALKLAGVQ